MNHQNRFNLIDEKWIPIVGSEKANLFDIFTDTSLRDFGGSPLQKIALQKLIQAIAQAAWTPENEDEWRKAGASGLSKYCLEYLKKWHDRFYLYGEKPFLQMPAIAKAKIQSFGAVLPEIATGNTTILTHGQVEQALDDSQKAVIVVQLMSLALGGKKVDNSVILSPEYTGKYNEKGNESNGLYGPGISHKGLLHSRIIGSSLQETVWLNLFDKKQIEKNTIFKQGLGQAPWEDMPQGEDCMVAKHLRESLMGRLVPISRFILLTEDGLHCSEGIKHPNYADGIQDPTVSVDNSKSKVKVLWVNPEKRPWRELTSLLSFLSQQKASGFDCWQLHAGIPRLTNTLSEFGIWSGGVRVSSNAGEQYLSGKDDMLESRIQLESSVLNEAWFLTLQREMDELVEVSKKLYGRVLKYYKEMNADGEDVAARATSLFWQECEREFPTLLSACGNSDHEINTRLLWKKICAAICRRIYNQLCANTTARQMQAWAKFLPR